MILARLVTIDVLHFIVTTPQQEVVKFESRSVRVVTETGQVGLRPKMEAVILAIEPGLILVHQSIETQFVGSAGGLLTCDGKIAKLLTPFAVSGINEQAVISELTRQLQQPRAELEVRNAISSIQTSILNELQEDRRARQLRGPL